MKRFWRDLICLMLGTAGILVIIDGILKPWFDRDRPDEKLLALGGPSFPSGHAAGSVVFYFMSCTLLAGHYPQLRRPLFMISSLWVALVWLSTIYVRAHWPSDILAGAVVGYLWLSFCLAGFYVWERYPPKK
ncbi:phosphatase PAP2 family protein [Prochlorococcus sp. MIT 1300]|uniref:phosphatase PAP2 family protein n=1 Tax=Prochlorococcus sp. MIT 1300 TaxID=3096218 RepID=UPI002A75C7B4|nr:phosphatase PAP2 family protein [Prochlorococcus sp. MIT 1300]